MRTTRPIAAVAAQAQAQAQVAGSLGQNSRIHGEPQFYIEQFGIKRKGRLESSPELLHDSNKDLIGASLWGSAISRIYPGLPANAFLYVDAKIFRCPCYQGVIGIRPLLCIGVLKPLIFSNFLIIAAPKMGQRLSGNG